MERYAVATLTVDLGALGEKEIEFHGYYHPATPDVMYLPNGDPGYPGDPAEFNMDAIYLLLGPDKKPCIELFPEDFLEDHFEALIEKCLEKLAEQE